MAPQSLPPEPTSLRFMHEFPRDLRDRADAYVAGFNEAHAPAKLTLRALINAAVAEYLDARAEPEAA